ncbi:MAG TPA: AMP-binding protein [Candidatus Binataceae bacterium]|nr:AMP-binding protein [Candidatus Binataceae bacterium]
MNHSGHVDRFVRDNLPPSHLQPEFIFESSSLLYPERLNCVSELLDKMVASGLGERICMRAHGISWTYADLLEKTNRIANVLVREMGLIAGNRVLLRADNHPMTAACWLAIVKAGGVAVPTMPLLRAAELGAIVEKAQVSLALCDERLAGELTSIRDTRATLTDICCFNGADTDGLEALMGRHSTDFENADTAADDPCLIVFTSGSTGRPKATIHCHRDVLAICDCWPKSILRATHDDVFVGTPPLAFSFGLGGLLLFPLRAGASTVLLEKSSPESLLQAIARFRATICFAAPTTYRMISAAANRYDLSSLKKCVSAGEALSASTRELWRTVAGIELIDGIGTTEMLHIFISADERHARPGATGKVVPGYRAMIVDSEGKQLPPGEIGRLAVKGPTGCRYLAEDNQANYVRNGWNLTGDAYRMDEDGYFYYQGRTDDMIISAGYNIGPPEIEEALMAHPQVAECAVIGVPDEERGEIVKAFVVPREEADATPELAKELQNFVKQRIAPYKYPRAIEFRKSLPRTEALKLQRFKLREEKCASSSGADAHDEKSRMQDTRILQPPGWPRPRGYSNGITVRGRQVFIAGQIGWDERQVFRDSDLTGQVRQALRNIVAVLTEAGGDPQHLVRMTWYVTDKHEYLQACRPIGIAYQEIIGAHYPPMSVVQVAGLLEDQAKVEIEATAVIPDHEIELGRNTAVT